MAGFSPATHDFYADPSKVVDDRASPRSPGHDTTGKACLCDVHPIALGVVGEGGFAGAGKAHIARWFSLSPF
jgi:hypothetical protein